MDFWQKLYRDLDKQRQQFKIHPDDCKNELGKILRQRLVKGRHAPQNIIGWLESKRGETRLHHTSCTNVQLNKYAQESPMSSHRGILLKNLRSLADDALLTISVSISTESKLLCYNIGVQGFELGTNGRRWYARMDLHEAPDGQPPKVKGGGYCNHALFHCQFGADPNDSAELPSARVPLPWLPPWEALQWVLATVEDGMEPEAFP